jgi:hypothetical protein
LSIFSDITGQGFVLFLFFSVKVSPNRFFFNKIEQICQEARFLMTSFELILAYPSAWLILCLLFSAGLSWLLYTRNYFGDDDRRWLRMLLAGLRIFFIGFLSFLLLSPLIKTSTREVEKPVVAIGIDNSASLQMNADSAVIGKKAQEMLDRLRNGLGEKYELRTFLFGERVREAAAPDYTDQVSNLSGFVKSMEDRFENRNLGALVVFSDGIYNQGENPLYTKRNLDAPVYTVNQGDTAVKRDLVLKEVRHNQLAYLGNTFPLVACVEASRLDGKRYELQVRQGEKILFREEQQISGERFRRETEIRLKADSTGVQQYVVSISVLEEEQSAANNKRNVFIDVLDGKNKILLLADAPHPDVNAIRQAVESNENYEITVHYPFSGAVPGLEGFNLLILHQLPAVSRNFGDVISLSEKSAVPVLFVLGPQSNIREYGRIASGLGIQASNLSMNEALPAVNQDFSLFLLNDESLASIARMPPLSTFYGKYAPVSPGNVLLFQKIGQVSTADPLLAFMQHAERKAGVLYGTGFWRWRLYDFERNGNHQATNELMSRVVQYLAVRNDKRQFRAQSNQKTYTTTERVFIEAELYNESYQLTNSPEVALIIRGQDKREFSYQMGREGAAYFLDAGFFAAGNYTFEAIAAFSGKELRASGRFTVMPLELEGINTLADHNLLRALADKNNGKSFDPDQVDLLIEELKSNENITSVSYLKTGFKDLVNSKWFFWLLLAFISVEWFIRKWKGSY